MNDIQNSLFEAIKLFADNSVQNSNATITIKAEIVDIVNPTKGIYKVKYLNDSLIAQTNSDTQYSVGDLVYVLVPDGDFSKDKIIVGAAAGQESQTTVGDTLGYYKISDNILAGDESFSGQYELCSYKTEEKVITLNNTIKETLKEYLTLSREICFSFKIQTRLNIEQINGDKRGRYGASLIVPMELSAPGYEETQNVMFTWTLDTYNMLGNVYKLEVPTLQTIRYMIGDEYEVSFDTNPDKPITLKLFCENFSHEKENMPNDIFFTDVDMSVVKSFTEEDMKGLSLMLQSSDGRIFRPNALSTKTISPIVKYNGKVLDSSLYDAYWFIEDLTVTADSEFYSANAGLGWRALELQSTAAKLLSLKEDYTTAVTEIINNESVEEEKLVALESLYDRYYGENGFITLATKEYDALIKGSMDKLQALPTLSIERDDDRKYTKYKCLVLYEDSILSEEIEIINLYADRNLQMVSVSGKNLITKDNSTFDLEVSFKKKGNEKKEDFSFTWIHSAITGDIITDFSYEQVVLEEKNGYFYQRVRIPKMLLMEQNIFKCTVHNKSNNKNLGTASIAIKTVESLDVRAHILNGDRIYKYDASGNAPSSPNYIGPASSRIRHFTPLRYQMFDKDGNEFKEAEYKACSYLWKVPENSLLVLDKKSEYELVDGYYLIHGTGNEVEIPYKLALKYNHNKLDGTIYLQVEYANKVYPDEVNIQFLRDGANGTNGTEYVATIQFDGYSCGELDSSGHDRNLRMFYDIAAKKWYYWDYNSKQMAEVSSRAPLLSAVVYKDGVEDTTAKAAYSWSWLDEKITAPCLYLNKSTVGSKAVHIIAQSADQVAKIPGTNNIDNIHILKAEIKIDGVKLPVFYPIEITLMPTLGSFVGIEGGFEDVEFTAQGDSPIYDNTSPFTAIGTWSAFGELEENTKVELLENQKQYKIKNIVKWDGNNRNYIKVTNNGVVTIRPIVFRYNRYGMAWLNDWDGTKLEIDTEGSYIVSPVVGAGKKNDKNQFTGMVMGEIVEGDKTKVGLTGRSNVVESFFLDAYTGKATFGMPNTGQIIIDPEKKIAGDTSAVIYGGNYSTTDKSGMMINLSKPEIRWGNGNFYVDNKGSFGFGNYNTEKKVNQIQYNADTQVLSLNDVVFAWAGTDSLGNSISNSALKIEQLAQTVFDSELALKGNLETTIANGDTALSNSITALDNAVANHLGINGTTVITDKAIISPYIAGGYLNITNDNRQVIIDPGYISQEKATDKYIFLVKNGSNTAIGLKSSGDATFGGVINATGGNIGGWNISGNATSGGSISGGNIKISCANNSASIAHTGGLWLLNNDGSASFGGGKLTISNIGGISATGGTFTDITTKGISGGTTYAWSITDAGIATFSKVNITGGTISLGRFTFDAASIDNNSADSIGAFKVDSNSFYYGKWQTSSDPKVAPTIFLANGVLKHSYPIAGATRSDWVIGSGSAFGITSGGAIYANNLNISGGSLGDWSLDSVTLYDPYRTSEVWWKGPALTVKNKEYKSYYNGGANYSKISIRTASITPRGVYIAYDVNNYNASNNQWVSGNPSYASPLYRTIEWMDIALDDR